ncbi:MAG: NAD(P)H-binding protein [Croceibacterium sp.]
MSDGATVLLAGATGLVGRTVMEAAMGQPAVRLVALSRREAPMPRGARMEMLLADPAQWHDAVGTVAPDGVICALGTTWNKAGRNEEAFRAVDFELVLHLARASKDAGASHFVLVSSAGADMASKTLYLRVKAEIEAAVTALRFKRLDILRPGLLRGKRGSDRRTLERLAIMASPLSDHLLRGARRGYRSIGVPVVAAAALQGVQEKAAGRFVHDNDAIVRLARRLKSAA